MLQIAKTKYFMLSLVTNKSLHILMYKINLILKIPEKARLWANENLELSPGWRRPEKEGVPAGQRERDPSCWDRTLLDLALALGEVKGPGL